MDKIIEKISSYNLITNILPGFYVMFFFRIEFIFILNGIDLFEKVILYYLVGLIISRIGSLLLEPLMIKLGFIKHSKYEDYLIISVQDGKIHEFLESANTYRSLSIASLIIIFTLGFRFFNDKTFVIESFSLLSNLLMFFVFAFSYRKQIQYINKRVKLQITQYEI